MPGERAPMRRLREILRLTFSGDVACRACSALGDSAIDGFYSTLDSKQGHRRHAEPDFSHDLPRITYLVFGRVPNAAGAGLRFEKAVLIHARVDLHQGRTAS